LARAGAGVTRGAPPLDNTPYGCIVLDMTATATTARNCRTATGTVHAAIIERDGRPRPACAGTAVNGMHYVAPTDEAITCRRCLGSTPSTADAGDKKARAAERRAATKRTALVNRTEAPARAITAHTERAAFLAGIGTAEALADLAAEVAKFAAIVADAQAAAETLAAL
jgi:hypothetical protein